MADINKNSNYIGEFFRQYIKMTGFDRKVLEKKLEMNYSNNQRMICAYFTKKDYLWEQFEVEKWCSALMIRKNTNIFKKLVEKCGKKRYDYEK